ncbi:hypothetical protein TSAR_006693 [Trichomalopsis sarcophagae]|uniref:Uncharacterized protein n=1 Tax=Trichomalopsis sarcophagae TaxID=543379 RepID=A0A232FGQ5_9HYME|nr:hypothetical protein TSAR_006693 [Trichomalopsis sarcophagae]
MKGDGRARKNREKSTILLKVPELSLGGESLGPKTSSQESLPCREERGIASQKERQRHERTAMQRETFTPRVPHDALEPLAKARSNEIKCSEGILVKAGQNRTYAEVLRKIRKEVNPDTTETMVLGVKQARSGDVLLKLGRRSDRTEFIAEVRKAVLSLGQVKKEEGKATLKIRDMDSEATEEEVRAAIGVAFRKSVNSRRVALLKHNTRGVRVAIVILGEREAGELLGIGHIRVGLVAGSESV